MAALRLVNRHDHSSQLVPTLDDLARQVQTAGDRAITITNAMTGEPLGQVPSCTPDDVAYLLRAVNAAVTEPVSEADVVGTWAGLRPLVRQAKSERTADLSRRHAVVRSAGGMITVTGGKLTTYRSMAADAVDAVRSGQADVGFFAIDPVRSDGIRFTAPYLLIEGAYLVRNASPLKGNDEVDRPGTRIVVGRGQPHHRPS